MNPARLFYRTHQLWKALAVQPADKDLDRVGNWLSPSQQALFFRLQPSEQAHSLDLLRRLIAQGESHPDLLAAALLHDVGKIQYPLQLWERVWVVLAHTLMPGWVKKWGSQPIQAGQPFPAWRKALMVAEQHPRQGAELAAQAGSTSMVVALILRHHETRTNQAQGLEDLLLRKLQVVDNET